MSWIDDGSGAVKPGSVAQEFVVEGARRGSPTNARFSTALTPEAGCYFEIDALVCGDGAFIGVSTQQGFGKGWGCNGLFFGGNLSSGGALVRQQFGDRPTTGTIVGVLVEFLQEGSERHVQVTFYQDGRCLGPGFVSKMQNPAAEVFPVVKADKDGDKYAIRFPPAPAVRDRNGVSGGGAGEHPAEGVWALQALRVGPELGQFPLQERLAAAAAAMAGKGRGRGPMPGGPTPGPKPLIFKVSREGAPGTYMISCKVCNKIRMAVTGSTDAPLVTPSGPPMSTHMMGPPELMEIEGLISSSLEVLRQWFVDNGRLLLNGPTMEMEFTQGQEEICEGEAVPAREVELS